MTKEKRKSRDWKEYYEDKSILDEITDDPVDLSLGDTLREEILSGKRKRKLKNVTIKVDPLQIMAIKKLSNMKSIPYQTLIRHWLSEGIKEELDSVLKYVPHFGPFFFTFILLFLYPVKFLSGEILPC